MKIQKPVKWIKVGKRWLFYDNLHIAEATRCIHGEMANGLRTHDKTVRGTAQSK